MLLLLKDTPILQIQDNGECRILNFLRIQEGIIQASD